MYRLFGFATARSASGASAHSVGRAWRGAPFALVAALLVSSAAWAQDGRAPTYAWHAGAPHSVYPHVYAAAEAGRWQPAVGFVWASKSANDLRVVDTRPARSFLERGDLLRGVLQVAHLGAHLTHVAFHSTRESNRPKAAFEHVYTFHWVGVFDEPGITRIAFEFDPLGRIVGVRGIDTSSAFRPFGASQLVIQFLRDSIREEAQRKGASLDAMLAEALLSERAEDLVAVLLRFQQL